MKTRRDFWQPLRGNPIPPALVPWPEDWRPKTASLRKSKSEVPLFILDNPISYLPRGPVLLQEETGEPGEKTYDAW